MLKLFKMTDMERGEIIRPRGRWYEELDEFLSADKELVYLEGKERKTSDDRARIDELKRKKEEEKKEESRRAQEAKRPKIVS